MSVIFRMIDSSSSDYRQLWRPNVVAMALSTLSTICNRVLSMDLVIFIIMIFKTITLEN